MSLPDAVGTRLHPEAGGSGGPSELAKWGALLEQRFPGSRLLHEYDGVGAGELADGGVAGAGAPLLVLSELPSTQDAAHALGEAGAPSGTVVLAERQTAGRGRQGRPWHSSEPSGVWVTLIDRPTRSDTLGVLSLRAGLLLAVALEPLTPGRPRVKWPNDVHVADGKLAGVLVEARWRDDRPDWVALGVGVNVIPGPTGAGAGGEGTFGTVRPGVTRRQVLRTVLSVLRSAVRGGARLAQEELSAWALRDMSVGRRCVSPMAGIVLGVSPTGALLVRDDMGESHSCLAGSLVLDEANA